jgi:hypothetical protein
MSDLDAITLTAAHIALMTREAECRKRGISSAAWTTARRKVQLELARKAAMELRPSDETPAFLRRQAD